SGMATPKGTFAELVANLADPSGEVRRRAVQKIMRRSRERQQAFEQFAQLLNDPDYQVYKVVIMIGKSLCHCCPCSKM
ncbi:MAG TPA: HEAT repeat domain-containing protein, partial [Ktedonobacteraceae bacterium]|nr:HEAT repeat domain-containing protein [Ktedonobacteraceae bacterium]